MDPLSPVNNCRGRSDGPSTNHYQCVLGDFRTTPEDGAPNNPGLVSDISTTLSPSTPLTAHIFSSCDVGANYSARKINQQHKPTSHDVSPSQIIPTCCASSSSDDKDHNHQNDVECVNKNENNYEPLSSGTNLNAPIILLGILNIFTDTALAASLVPILPLELKLDQIHEGVILAIGSVTSIMCGPLCGWMSDTRGWINVLVWFYPLICLSAALLMTAHRSFWIFVIARLVGGMGSGVMYPSSLSMIVATHHSSVRATAVGLALAGDIGSFCGPLMGGFIYDRIGAYALYAIMLFICLINFIVFIILSRQVKKVDRRKFDDNGNNTLSQGESIYNIRAIPLIPNAQNLEIKKSFSEYQEKKGTQIVNESYGGHLIKNDNMTERNINKSDQVIMKDNHHHHHSEELFDQTILSSEIPYENMEMVRESKLDKMRVFLTLDFAVRFFTLFYCWGVALSSQAVLPIIWTRLHQLKATTIGLLFSPHLLGRVCMSAFSPLFSDLTGTSLHILISCGLGLAVVATMLLAVAPMAPPVIQSFILGLLGMGLGITDGCVTAWAGGFSDISKSADAFHGRAFAVMALACDGGMLLVPLFGSTISQFESFSLAYLILGSMGLIILSFSVYCGRREAASSFSLT